MPPSLIGQVAFYSALFCSNSLPRKQSNDSDQTAVDERGRGGCLQALTRCSQQEPDNGEAWNNIAAIHLQLQHAPEAFSALGEAVKLKRDSWQTWSNYAQAALQTDNNLPAARAVQKVSSAWFHSPCCEQSLALGTCWSY